MWRLVPEQNVRWRGWDDEYVVFNDLSGDTHLLGHDAITILWQLAKQPSSTAVLAQQLAASSGDAHGDDGDDSDLRTLLDSLSNLSLIEQCQTL